MTGKELHFSVNAQEIVRLQTGIRLVRKSKNYGSRKRKIFVTDINTKPIYIINVPQREPEALWKI